MVHKKTVTTVLLVILAILAAAMFQGLRLKRSTRNTDDQEYLQLVSEAMDIIKKKYVEKVNDKKLAEGAVTGMLAALDPHSAYLSADSFKEMNIQMSGSFGGVGMEVNMVDGWLTVVSPIDDTPAFRAGIASGDIIWKIDGKPTRNLGLTEAVNRMRGPKGTRVSLTIVRKKTPKPLVFDLVRDTITTKSVKTRTLEPGFGYIRIAHFQERSSTEFANALVSLRSENKGKLKGLVIDLRNNPGGLLDQVVPIAGRFIDTGKEKGLIVYTKGREESSRMTLTTGSTDKEPPYPVVVLINSGSASAAEILAGALQDHKRGVIMGTQSFGKGSVQSIFPLPGGAGLKLTTAKYYTPKGRSIQARGITPDIIVEAGDIPARTDKKELPLRESDLENHIKNDNPAPLKKEARPADTQEKKDVKDYQLARALDLLKGMTAIGRRK